MRKIVSMGLLLLLFLLPAVVLAQEPTAQPTEQSTGTRIGRNRPIIHVVVEGDTLFGIAQQYNTTVAALLFLNNLTETSVLTLGRQLIVSGDVPEVTPVPDSAETDPTIPQSTHRHRRRHIVLDSRTVQH